MASQKLLLRVKYSGKQFVIDSLRFDNTIGELKAIIWSQTQVHPDTCRILIGYPPEQLFLVDDQQLIGDIIKNSRECLLLESEKLSSSSSSSSNNNNNNNGNDIPPSSKTRVPSSKPQIVRIPVDANNSCLFVSVHFCLTNELQEECPQLRELIASTVKADPITYNEGFLGKPNDEYCNWIRDKNHWGGGIELSILSKHFGIEIVAIDIQSVKAHYFGEDKHYPNRILLIFDGIHYDPLALQSSSVNKPLQTKFDVSETEILKLAFDFVQDAKKKHLYTDLVHMKIRCNECNQCFSRTDAAKHASASGHTNFDEVKN